MSLVVIATLLFLVLLVLFFLLVCLYIWIIADSFSLFFKIFVWCCGCLIGCRYFLAVCSISKLRLADRLRLPPADSSEVADAAEDDAAATTGASIMLSSKSWFPVPKSRSPTSPIPGMTMPQSVSSSSTIPTVTETSGWVFAKSSNPGRLPTTVIIWIFGTPHYEL